MIISRYLYNCIYETNDLIKPIYHDIPTELVYNLFAAQILCYWLCSFELHTSQVLINCILDGCNLSPSSDLAHEICKFYSLTMLSEFN